MTDADYGAFETAFKRLSGAFRLHMKRDDQAQLTRTYFLMLKDHPLRQVLDTGKQLLSTSTRMPLPAQWLSALTPGPTAPADVRQMTLTEAHELEHARTHGYRGDLCACPQCVAADVAW